MVSVVEAVDLKRKYQHRQAGGIFNQVMDYPRFRVVQKWCPGVVCLHEIARALFFRPTPIAGWKII